MSARTETPAGFISAVPPGIAFAVLGIALADVLWASLMDFRVTNALDAATRFAAIGLMATLYLHLRPNRRLAEMAVYVFLWVSFSCAGAVFTYLCATSPFPLQDRLYELGDKLLGFDLAAWTQLLQRHALIFRTLQFSYDSLLPQIAFSVLYFAHVCARGRNALLMKAAMIGLLLSALIAALLPALGPSPGSNPVFAAPGAYVAEILAMRSGQPVSRTVAELQGIVCFPSYHTVLAILLVWSHRGLKTFWPMTVINLFMLLSVPSVGNHYLVDVLGGAGVAVLSVILAAGSSYLPPSSLLPYRLVSVRISKQ